MSNANVIDMFSRAAQGLTDYNGTGESCLFKKKKPISYTN